MNSVGATQGEPDHGHGVHLPDPSIWPLIVGLAAFAAAAALIWWTRDRDSQLAGVGLGVGLAFVLFSIAGWARDDSLMRKKTDSGEGAAPRAPRFTQVLVFALHEGTSDRAWLENGVLARIEKAEYYRYEGFEDLRVTIAPAANGAAQVLVETSWRGREGLHFYESTRETLLDLVNGCEDEVVPGSVQIFDMEVVRDTKDTAFRFSRGALVTLVGALTVACLALAAGLALF